MDPHYRRLFNEQFTDEIYASYVRDLSALLQCTFAFRIAETPVFLTDDFKAKLIASAQAILDQLMEPARLERMKRAIPDRWNTPGMDALPNFTQVDFAIVEQNGEYVPKLIELQGFPSLTALQVAKRDVWRATLGRMKGLDLEWSCWFSGFDRASFLDLARRTIVGDHDPNEVVLMDIDPAMQKTSPDFNATRWLFGVHAVDPRDIIKRGKHLFRGSVQIKRIYNRIVFDELASSGIAMPFDYRDELDVEWASHPNWYWVWSKYSLPFLDHPAVPKATFVSDIDRLPDDFETNYVLKPLFSFAGGGVNVEPTAKDVAAIPEADRDKWCIQEKIEYASAIQAADGGGVKAEIRMMFLRPDDAPRPILAQNLARLSRGKLLGVNFNKEFTWVGSSVALSPSS